MYASHADGSTFICHSLPSHCAGDINPGWYKETSTPVRTLSKHTVWSDDICDATYNVHEEAKISIASHFLFLPSSSLQITVRQRLREYINNELEKAPLGQKRLRGIETGSLSTRGTSISASTLRRCVLTHRRSTGRPDCLDDNQDRFVLRIRIYRYLKEVKIRLVIQGPSLNWVSWSKITLVERSLLKHYSISYGKLSLLPLSLLTDVEYVVETGLDHTFTRLTEWRRKQFYGNLRWGSAAPVSSSSIPRQTKAYMMFCLIPTSPQHAQQYRSRETHA